MLRTTPTAATALLALVAALPLTRTSAPTSPVEGGPPCAWLAGPWVGEGLGGTVEEIWSPTRGGVMMGMFRSLAKGKTAFYELMTIEEGRDGWEMRLRHFHPDLRAWEERDEPLVWPLAHRDETSVVFGPVTYELVGPDELRVWVELDEDAEPAEIRYTRARYAADQAPAKEIRER